MNTTATPSRGRPRSAEADDAILSAALDLLAERKDVGGISMEAIAARAGVGKATIYRRWPGKVELFTDAVTTLRSPLPRLGTGSARDDLVKIVAQICDEMDSPLQRAISTLMMSESHPEIGTRIKRQVVAPRHEAVFRTLERGIERGELDPGLHPDTVLYLLVGGALSYVRNATDVSPQRCAELLVDTVCLGIDRQDGADDRVGS
ncbi:AcrR family transcriptional regulator [Nocardiopsis mwathae]|uniref:AcrR family transcriptional regulator n=1 Tax=Nocardiopsis mwathae TaxID=1472723 RepID=A0A7W9YK01_9ACTN|nr:TetR/AcrR family transcriptional regulator [Nocardiopsis mwathae]MBB6172601.1 AcrR family transcriptional regulator [Nocardiopsis mwathae]